MKKLTKKHIICIVIAAVLVCGIVTVAVPTMIMSRVVTEAEKKRENFEKEKAEIINELKEQRIEAESELEEMPELEEEVIERDEAYSQQPETLEEIVIKPEQR